MAADTSIGISVPGRPWPKGVSGNPSGRPRSALREIREKLQPHADAFVAELIAKATTKDRDQMEAIKLALSYLYGKPGEIGPMELTKAELLAAVNEHLATDN